MSELPGTYAARSVHESNLTTNGAAATSSSSDRITALFAVDVEAIREAIAMQLAPYNDTLCPRSPMQRGQQTIENGLKHGDRCSPPRLPIEFVLAIDSPKGNIAAFCRLVSTSPALFTALRRLQNASELSCSTNCKK